MLAEIQTAIPDSIVTQASAGSRSATRRRASRGGGVGATRENQGKAATAMVAAANSGDTHPTTDVGATGSTLTPLHEIKFRYWKPEQQPKTSPEASQSVPDQPSSPVREQPANRLFFRRYQWQTIITTVMDLLNSNGKGEVTAWSILCRVIPARQVTDETGYSISSPELRDFFLGQLEMAVQLISNSPSGNIENSLVSRLGRLGPDNELGELLSKKFKKRG